MSLPREAQGGGGSQHPRRKKRRQSPTHVPAPAPQTDVQSSGGDYGTKKAERHKKTSDYRRSVRTAYESRPVEERRARARQAKHREKNHVSSPEDEIVLADHRLRKLIAPFLADRARRDSPSSFAGDLDLANEYKRAEKENAARDSKADLPGDLAVADAYKHSKDFLLLKALAAKKGYERADEATKDKMFGNPKEDAKKPGVVAALKEAETAGVNPTDDALSKAFSKLVGTSASSAAFALNQAARPSHAVAGGAKALVEGKGVGKAASEAAKPFYTEKGKTTFSDVLESAGVHNKVAKAVGGLAGDIVTDPLNLVSFGTASAARKAAEHAFTDAIAAGKTQEEALKAARAVYDATPGKAAGPTVGVRARVPFTHKGFRAQTSGKVSSRVAEGVKATTRAATHKGDGKLGLRHAPEAPPAEAEPRAWYAAMQKMKGSVAANARHADVHPVDEDFIRQAASEGRVRRSALEREALNRAHAYAEHIRKNGITAEQQHEMALAIDAGDLDRLEDPELRHLAEVIQHDLKDAGEREVALQIRSMLIGEREAPAVPAVAADPDAAREALRQAKRERGAAERDLRATLRGEGTTQGRAEVLSRNVQGARGENEAAQTARALDRLEKKAGKSGQAGDVLRHMDEVERLSENGYRAGGHGAREGRGARMEAERRVAEAKAAEKEAQTTFDKVMRQHKEEVAANQKGLDDLAAHEREAKGYFPRRLRDDDRESIGATPASSETVRGKSLNQRKVQDRLELLPEGKQAQYLTDDASRAVGLRLLEHANMVATAETLNRLGALGEKVEHLDDLPNLSTETLGRLVVKTPRGYTPLVRQKGFIPEGDEVGAAIAKAVEKGDDVRLIPKREFDLAFELMNRGRGATNKIGDTEIPLLSAYDKAQGGLKTLLTIVNPGFHGTNLVGDTFNFRAGGGRSRSLLKSGRLLSKERSMTRSERSLDRDAKGGILERGGRIFKDGGKREKYGDLELTDGDLVELARQHGAIQRGMAGHELRELRGGDELGKQQRRFRPMEGIRNLNEQREDLIRLASFHSAMKRGLDPEKAAAWTNQHHFDYGDLTMTERAFMRRVIPFYTFWSRNLPLQVKSLARNPGLYANLELAREESYKAAGLDPDDYKKLPKYAQQGVPLMLPFKVAGVPVALYPKLPVTDLNTLDPRDLGNQIMQRTTPLVKVPFEMFTGYNFFFKDMHTKARVPAPPQFLAATNGGHIPKTQDDLKTANEIIAGITSTPGFPGGKVENAVKMIRDPKTGKMVPGWSWKIDLLLRQTPALNTLSSMMTERTTNQTQTQSGLSAVGYLLGPRPGLVDPVAIKQQQLFEEHDRLEKEAEDLKPTVEDHAPGEQWKGRIAQINKRVRKIERQIAKLDKKQGFKVPRFGATLPQGGSGWGAGPRGGGSPWEKSSSGGGGWK